MKVRRDFVTNSSSSSFVISRDAVSYDELIRILLEIANLEADYNWRGEDDEEKFTIEEDVTDNRVTHRYVITEATPEKPYTDWDDHIYNNHFIIDNESYVRYDWDAIEEVLNKYNINFHYGYCD